MSKRINQRNLIIPKKIERDILRWALSRNEIYFLCFGKNNLVAKAVRISNISASKKNTFVWDRVERSDIEMKMKKMDLKLLAEGHSHPSRHHLRHPSLKDRRYLSRKIPQIIAFPIEQEIKCWMLKETSKETLKNQIKLIAIN